MEAPRGGLVVEQLTPVRHRTGFEELAGISQGRAVSVGVTDAGLLTEEAAARFTGLVRAAMRLQHPHVAQTLAIDAAGPGRFAVLWERFEGATLDRILAERGTLLPDEAVSVASALAQALNAAHALGVVHGGLGAEWVTLTTGPLGLDTRLAGFGLGQLPALTGGPTPTVAGDITALGVLLHQLLTGEVPKGKLGALPANAVHLSPVLARVLATDDASRFRTVAEFEQTLADANRTRVSGGTVLPHTAKPGGIGLRTLGAWELVELLGEGAMGQVFLGRHTLLGRRAAIKVLRPEQYQREDLIQRFFQEARSVNQINHEHIVEISDFGQELGPDGHPTAVYFVMELLEGETLTTRLAKGALPVERVLHIVRQLASALAAAHKLGVVHRDVKTDNVFLIKRQNDHEYVKVLDFGVAKLTQPTEAAPTVSTMDGAIIGTPTSMSPEQASGGVVDQRSDVYAVGVLLYLMLSGKLPIDAENFGKLIALLLTTRPAPLPEKTPRGEPIPPELAALCMRCLEKDPARRPQSMEALVEGLTAAPTLDAPPPGRRGVVGVVVALALAAAAGAAVLFWPRPVEPVVEPPIDAGAVVVAPEVPDAAVAEAVIDAGAEEPEDAGAEAVAEVVDAGQKPKVVKVKPVELTPALTLAAIARGRPAIDNCIFSHRQALPPAAGSLKVGWVIEPDGDVSGVDVKDPSLKGTPLEKCVVKGVKAFRFPRHTGGPKGSGISFTYPAAK